MKKTDSLTYFTIFVSPIGKLLLTGNGKDLTGLNFQDGTHPEKIDPDWVRDDAQFAQSVEQLEAYFAGDLKQFDLPMAPKGTDFQMSVWEALCSIPYGRTISYGQLAEQIGNPKAVRAVGGANGKNPIAIIVPCHRVIGSDGTLTGFGGGLPIKEALLTLEGNRSHKIASSQQAFHFASGGECATG